MKTVVTAALIAAAPAALAAALITAPAAPALACAAAAVPASADTLAKFTSSSLLPNTSSEITSGRTGFPEQLAATNAQAADLQGRRDGLIIMAGARSCL